MMHKGSVQILRRLLTQKLRDAVAAHKEVDEPLKHLEVSTFTLDAQIDDKLSLDRISHTAHKLKRHRFERTYERDVRPQNVLGVNMRNRHRSTGKRQAGGIRALTLRNGVTPRWGNIAAGRQTMLERIKQLSTVIDVKVNKYEIGADELTRIRHMWITRGPHMRSLCLGTRDVKRKVFELTLAHSPLGGGNAT